MFKVEYWDFEADRYVIKGFDFLTEAITFARQHDGVITA